MDCLFDGGLPVARRIAFGKLARWYAKVIPRELLMTAPSPSESNAPATSQPVAPWVP